MMPYAQIFLFCEILANTLVSFQHAEYLNMSTGVKIVVLEAFLFKNNGSYLKLFY